jgi:hypothetical protein
MFPLQCPFCDHANPDGARFCNACGSRLHLRMCNQCEAVNDQDVKNCYQCGTEFPVSSTTPEAAARAACARLQQLLRSHPPVSPVPAPTTASATTTDTDVGFEHGHAPIPESVVESDDGTRHQPGEAASAPGQEVEVPSRELRSLNRRRSISRVAPATVLSTVLLSAVAVSAYYVFRDPVQLTERVSATLRNSSAPAELNPSGTPTRPIPEKNGLATPSETPTTPDASSVAAIEALGLASPAGSSTAKGAGEAPHAATTLAAKPRNETKPAATNQVPPADSPANRSTTAGSASVQSPMRRSRVNVPPTSSRQSVCTEAVAAAGLCNLNSTEGSK